MAPENSGFNEHSGSGGDQQVQAGTTHHASRSASQQSETHEQGNTHYTPDTGSAAQEDKSATAETWAQRSGKTTQVEGKERTTKDTINTPRNGEDPNHREVNECTKDNHTSTRNTELNRHCANK